MQPRSPLVSVVTPVYNGEKYLSECIESVLRQSYTNFEYIIVDNCSTDRSEEIIKHYENSDERIRCIKNAKHLQVIQNWNSALQFISPESKYCKIVHADDWIFPECLDQMVQLAENHSSVSIVSAYRLVEDRVDLDGIPISQKVLSGKDVCRQDLLGKLRVFGSPTSLLIKSINIRATNPSRGY